MKMLKILMLLACLPMAFAAVSGSSSTPNPPNFLITSPLTNLCKGQVNLIPINVTNAGLPAYQNLGSTNLSGPGMTNVQVSISNSKDLYNVGNSVVEVPNIYPDTSKVLYIPIFISVNSTSLVSTGISINYWFDEDYMDSEVRNISFAVENCGSPLTVGISPKSLTSGSPANLMINLTNTGTTALSAISLHLAAPSSNLAWLQSQSISINSIAPKQSIEVPESVYISNNNSEFFPINVTATFYNGTYLGQISDTIEMLSSGVISLTESSLAVSPTTITPGGIFSISFVLTNLGTTGASTVTVTAQQPAGFTPFGSNSVFVGALAASGQTPVTLTFTAANNTKSGTYQIPIEVNYLNGLRINESWQFNVSVPALSAGASRFGSGGTFNGSRVGGGRELVSGGFQIYIDLTIALAVSTIVLLVLYMRERRKRKRNAK